MRKKTSKYSIFYFHLNYRRAKSLKVDSEAAESLGPWRTTSLAVTHYESGGMTAFQASSFCARSEQDLL